jgi:hypothetical protein
VHCCLLLPNRFRNVVKFYHIALSALNAWVPKASDLCRIILYSGAWAVGCCDPNSWVGLLQLFCMAGCYICHVIVCHGAVVAAHHDPAVPCRIECNIFHSR